MISVGLPKVTLGEVRLRTISLGAERDEQKPKPPQQGNYLLMEGGNYMLYEDGSRALLESGGGNSMDDMPITISLSTNGTDIFVSTSRALDRGEYPFLLRRGSARSRRNDGRNYLRRNKWCVCKQCAKYDNPFFLENGTNRFCMIEEADLEVKLTDLITWKLEEDKDDGSFITIRKSQNSNMSIPFENGRTSKVCYGIAIYKDKKIGRYERVSNVCYFRSNVNVTSDDAFEQWISV